MKERTGETKCRFCEKKLAGEEMAEGHGYCHECYWIRRILRRARKSNNQVSFADPYEQTLWSSLRDHIMPQKHC